MTILNPTATWLFLLLPFIVLLYFLRLRRPRFLVSSTYLWRRMINDMRVNTPFQKLRKALLLLLQLLALIALAIAAVRPLQQLKTAPEESIIILLDRSASMQTKHQSTSRFREALRHVSRLVDELGAQSEMAIVSFSNETVIEQSFTGNRRDLAGSIASLTCSDAAGVPGTALELAMSLVIARPRARVVYVSDSMPTTTTGELPFELEFIQIGEPVSNLAITGIDARRLPDNLNTVEIHLSLRRYGDARSALVTLSNQSTRLAARLPEFNAEGTASLIISTELPDSAVLSVKIETDDALTIDNQAWCAVPAIDTFSVELDDLGADQGFFGAALQAVPFVTTASPEKSAPPQAVIQKIAEFPTSPPTRNELLILHGGKHAIPKSSVIDWETDTQLTRHIDFSELHVSECAAPALPEAYRPLVRANNLPLISTLRSGTWHRTVIAFEPNHSNWPLQPSFPLFLHNWISHLQRSSSHVSTTSSRVGERRSIGANIPPGANVSISGPEKRAKGVAIGGHIVVSNLDRAGVYEITIGNNKPLSIAANLTDSDESNTMSNAKVISTATPVMTVPARVPASKEWTAACLTVALLVLMIEWSAYHRIIRLPVRQAVQSQ